MRLSIITIARVDIQELAQTCISVDAQLWPIAEHIVVASGFCRDKLNFVYGNFTRPYRKFLIDLDESIYNAMNIGLRIAVGSHVLFLNAGDTLVAPSALSMIAKRVNQNPLHCVLFSTLQKFETDVFVRPPGGICAGNVKLSGHQGFIAPIDTSVSKRIYFDESDLIAADLVWMARNMETWGSVGYKEVVAVFELGGVSNLPSFRALVLYCRSGRYTTAFVQIPKIILRYCVGLRRYYRIQAAMRGNERIDTTVAAAKYGCKSSQIC